MMQLKSHSRQVDLWMDQRLRDLSHDEVIHAFHKAFERVWAKAELTLGRVTMQAIADRIVHVGREEYAWLASILNKPDGIDVSALLGKTLSIGDAELRQGLARLMVEFLRVLGHLTAEIISSKLHAALMDDSPSSSVKGEKT